MESSTTPSVLNLILQHGEYLLFLILEWCSMRTQLDLAQVSNERFCEDDRIWKKFIQRDFGRHEDNNAVNKHNKTNSAPNFKIIYAQLWIKNNNQNEALRRKLSIWFINELNTMSRYIDFSDNIRECLHVKTKFLPNDFTASIKYFGCIQCNMWMHLVCDKKKASRLLLKHLEVRSLPEKYKKAILGERTRMTSDPK